MQKEEIKEVIENEEKIIKSVDKTKKALAGGILIILSLFLIYAILPYINAFIGAIILFTLLKPLYNYFTNKKNYSKKYSAILVIIISIIIIVIPSIFAINIILQEIGIILEGRTILTDTLNGINTELPQTEIGELLIEIIPEFLNYLKNFFIEFGQGIGNWIIIIVIMFFLLYYLLINQETLYKKICQYIPFNTKNSNRLIKEFENITYSTIITTGIIAIVQGTLLTASFLIFGVKGAFFWGFITIILSFLPIVGPPIIWVPAVIIQLINHQYVAGIGILISGLILSNIDNFLLRPYLQHKMGQMHPLISLIGIFIGIPFFGLFGIVIGPLLLSYFLLLVRMFKEEYF